MISNKITTGMDTKVKLSGSDHGSLVADPTEGETTMNSPKRLARIAGVLYLLVGIFGGFAEGFVEPKMYVAGNAAATASNLLANSGLVRLGVVADLFNATVWIFLGMTLTPSTMGSSSRRSSLACGWCRWGISPTNQQGGFPSGWASCSSWGAPATSWTCSRSSWSPTSAKRSIPSSSSRQQSRRSRWSSTCS